MENQKFTSYEWFVVLLLATLQFTVVLDFMVLSPLGAILLEELKISTAQFGVVVSAYAFSAGISGFLAAGFADKYDRKSFLLFFYAGFVVGTVLCGLAPSYYFLLGARIITGIFGGVISSISFAIITDLFHFSRRGRVMGFVQMAFAASQVLGIPVGLVLANAWGWHAPFLMIAFFALGVGIVIWYKLRPVNEHLQIRDKPEVYNHLRQTISNRHYLLAFMGTTVLATGGYMLMPFGTAYGIYNMGLTMEQLPLIYVVTGAFNILFGPLIGILSDRMGKYLVFVFGSVLAMILVLIYTRLGITPLWLVLVLNVVMFLGITARMIPASALMTGVPVLKDRGAFMSINASVQQLAGGIASLLAGWIVVQNEQGQLLHYDWLGYVVVCTMVLSMWILFLVQRRVQLGGQN